MGLEGIFTLLKIADLAATAAINYGVDHTKLTQMQAVARSEGRGLSIVELEILANDAQAAIDAIGSDPTP